MHEEQAGQRAAQGRQQPALDEPQAALEARLGKLIEAVDAL